VAAKRKTKAKRKGKAAEAPAKPHGGQTIKTPEVCALICERLSKGEPLAQICRDAGMPAARTVREWQEKDDEFSAAIARAREDGFDAIAIEALEIADDGSRDYKTGPRGIVVDQDHVQRSKLRVETRLKLLAKWDPKRYGERLQTELSGPDGGPIQTRYKSMDDVQLDAEIARRALALGIIPPGVAPA
jgi:hypothetical protein